MAAIFSLQLKCSYDMFNTYLKDKTCLGRRCVVRYALGLRYVIRSSVK